MMKCCPAIIWLIMTVGVSADPPRNHPVPDPKPETEVTFTIHREKPELIKKREQAATEVKKGEAKTP